MDVRNEGEDYGKTFAILQKILKFCDCMDIDIIYLNFAN